MPPVRIYADGKTVTVDEEQIATAIRDGTWNEQFGHLKNPQVNVVSESGEAGSIPFDQGEIVKQFQKNARFESDEESEKANRQAAYGEGFLEPAKATVEAGLRGFTAGGSDYALAGLHEFAPGVFPSKEVLEARRGANPGLAQTAEIGGMVVPALMSGGATAAGLGLGKAAASRLGAQAVEQTVARKLLTGLPGAIERTVAATTAGRGLGAQIVARGAEGMFYGGLSGMDTAFLQNEDIGREMAAGALMGFGLGAATPAAGAVLKGLGRSVAGKVFGRGAKASSEAAEATGTPLGKTAREGAEAGETPLSEAAAEAAEGPVQSQTAREAQVLEDIKNLDGFQQQKAGLTPDEVEAVAKAKTKDELPISVQQKAAADTSIEELRVGAGVFGKVYSKLVDKLSNSMGEKGILRLMQGGKKGAEIRHLAENADDMIDEMSRTGAETETGWMRLMKRIGAFSRQFKPQGMEHLVQAPYSEDVLRSSMGHLEALEKQIGDMIEAGAGDFAELKKAQKLREAIGLQIKALEKVAGGEEKSLAQVFMTLDQTKQIMGKYTADLYRKAGTLGAETGGGAALSRQMGATAARYEESYMTLRSLLENDKIWGKAAAEAQQDINKSWTALIGNSRAEGKSIIREWEPFSDAHTSNWERQFIGDQGRLKGVLQGSASVEGELDYAKLMQMQTLRKELMLKHIKHYKLGDKAVWGDEAITVDEVKRIMGEHLFKKGGKFADLAGEKDVSKFVESVADRYGGLLADAKQVRQLGDLWAKSQKGAGGLLSKVGAVTGIDISKPGALIGIEQMADKIRAVGEEAIGAIRKSHGAAEESIAGTHRKATESIGGVGRAAAEQVVGVGKTSAKAIEETAKQGLESMVEAQNQAMAGMAEAYEAGAQARRAQANVKHEAARNTYQLVSKFRALMGLGGPTAIVPAVAWESGARGKLAEKRMDERLMDLITNPKRAGEVAKNLGLDEANPAAKNVISALLESAPKPKEQYLFDQLRGAPPEIDEGDLRQWKKDKIQMARNPSYIADLISQGDLRPEHVEFFKRAYPGTYRGLVEQTKLWLAQGSKKIPRQRLEQLSVFIGRPLVGTADIKLASHYQRMYQANDQEQAQRAQKRAAGTLSAAKNKQLSDHKVRNEQTFADQILS